MKLHISRPTLIRVLPSHRIDSGKCRKKPS